MRQLLAIARKEFLLWAQNPGSWIIVFVVPFLFIWIMQAVFGSTGNPVVTVYAVNLDKGKTATQVMQALGSTSNLKIETLQTREEADRRVGMGERMAAIVIPPGFSQDLQTAGGAQIELIVDPARSQQASIVNGLVNEALAPIIVDAEVNRGVGNSIGQVMKSLETGQTPSAPATGIGSTTTDPQSLTRFFTAAIKGIVSSQVEDALNNPQVQMESLPLQSNPGTPAKAPSLLDYLVPGYSLMFVFFLVASLAVTVIHERQSGTLRRLLVAPVPRSRILLGKMLPFFLIAVVQFVVVLGISSVIFNLNFGQDWISNALGLGIIIAASSLSMTTLGILVAALAQTEGQADGLAIVLVLAMAVASGAMFPNISIPGLQAVTPHYWALQGFLNVLARGQGIEGVLRPAGILLTMSAVFFTAGAIRFRFE